MKTLLLVCTDEEYVTSILGTLSNSISEEYRISVITDRDYLFRFLAMPHKIDTLLIEERIQPEFPTNQAVNHIYTITESDRIGANLINKYAGVSGIMKILGSGYLKRNGSMSIEGQSRIHDIVSVSDSYIKTVTALSLAAQLSKFGRKVLYISADNIQDFNSFLFGENEEVYAQESDALIINAISNGITGEMDKLIKNGEFDYIPQFNHLLSSYGMSSDTMIQIAEIIRKLDIYEDIILEHPFGFPVESLSRLEKSKSIIIVSDQSKMSERKLSKILDNTRQVRENSLLVCQAFDDNYFQIPECKTMCGISVCESLGRIPFGDSVSSLVEKKYFRNTAEAVL